YRGRPGSLFRFRQPSCTGGHGGRVNSVHGSVTRHPRGVGGLEPIAGAAMDTGGLQDIGHMLGVVDAIELVLQFSGNVHLDKVDIVSHGDTTSCYTLCTTHVYTTGNCVGHAVEYRAGYRPTQREPCAGVGHCRLGPGRTWVALLLRAHTEDDRGAC